MGTSKKQKDGEECGVLMGVFIIFYFLPSILMFITGLSDANSFFKTGCDKKPSKIEYVYPSYRLGCYLNKEPK